MNKNYDKALKSAISRAKSRGFITYEELNNALPPDAVSSEDIEKAMTLISDLGIDLVEEEPADSVITPRESRERSSPNLENPLSKVQRKLLLKSSRLAKEQGLLEPYQRRYLYFGGHYDNWFNDLPEKLSRAIDDLLPKEDDGVEGALSEITLDQKNVEILSGIQSSLNYLYSEIRAIEGDPHAQENCGDYFYWGLHSDVDKERALYWYERAAEQDYVTAMVKLGKLYFFNDQDPQAVKWFEKAITYDAEEIDAGCIDGEPYAYLGQCYLNGFGVEQDYNRAIELLKVGAELQDEIAEYLLGICYQEGLGVEANPELAFAFVKRSADQDNQDAIELLAEYLATGFGTDAEPERADELIKQLDEPVTDEEKFNRARLKQHIKPLAPEVSSEQFTSVRDVAILEYGNVVEFPVRHPLTEKERREFSTHKLKELIDNGENDRVEYKSSLRFDVERNSKNPNLELVIVKAVAGLLNGTGGTLLIGVNDQREPIGIEEDLNTFASQKDPDRDLKNDYELHLRELFKSTIEIHPATRAINVSFETVNEKTICVVTVEPSEEPVTVSLQNLSSSRIREEKPREDGAPGKTKEQIKAQYDGMFFVRNGNKTDPLSPAEAAKYTVQHFNKTTQKRS